MLKSRERPRIRVLFVHWPLETRSYIERDIYLLRKHFDVITVCCSRITDIIRVLVNVPRVDVTFVWFGGKAAAATVLFSKLFRKKSIVVAAGYDAAKVPEIGYGAMLNPIARLFTTFSFKYANVVLAVSNSTRKELLTNIKLDPRRVKTVYHCFDHTKFKPGKKERLVITVGRVNRLTILKKGLEDFVRSAAFLPDVKFVLIGPWEDDSILFLKSIATPNVTFTGYLPFQDLLKYMKRAKVYVQASRHESFACSLAEAMLCECVPVVTRVAAIPEVVGENGFYVPLNDLKQIASKIKEALESDLGKSARKRIINLFPLKKREKELVNIIKNLMNNEPFVN